MVRNVAVPVLILLAAALLAGCTEPPPEPEEPAPELPRLASFGDCPWSYPDNTSVDCENHATPLEAEAEYPMTWICTDQNRDQGWSLHWNPVTSEYGLWVEIPENATGHVGVLYLRTNEEEHLFQWDEAPREGFLRFPVEFGTNASFRYVLHEFGYVTNGTLSTADPTPVWSLYATQFWVVHRFDTQLDTYTFQNMTTRSYNVENNPGVEQRVYYEPTSFDILGEDFHMQLHHEQSHVASSQGLAETLMVDRFCHTGLGSQ